MKSEVYLHQNGYGYRDVLIDIAPDGDFGHEVWRFPVTLDKEENSVHLGETSYSRGKSFEFEITDKELPPEVSMRMKDLLPSAKKLARGDKAPKPKPGYGYSCMGAPGIIRDTIEAVLGPIDNKEITMDDLPITKHVSENPSEDKTERYEAVGNSVVHRYWVDHGSESGLATSEIAKCRPGDNAQKIAKLMNAGLKAEEMEDAS